ncbi:thioredoxin domain-containing protein [bacterium]|nr:thioredoxin domain-containing protein [bacterium]
MMHLSFREAFPKRWWSAVLLSTLGLLLALYSSYEYVHVLAFPSAGEAACNFNAQYNCEQAIKSPFAALLGRSLGSWGALFYSSLLLFFASCSLRFSSDGSDDRKADPESEDVLAAFVVTCLVSLFASLVLLWISLETLTAYCPVCLSLYLVSFLLAVVALSIPRTTGVLPFLGRGIRRLSQLPFSLPVFLLSSFRRYGWSGELFRFLFLGVLVVASLFSDSLFAELLASTSKEGRGGGGAVALSLWKAQPVQEIPFDGSEGYQRDYRKGNGSIRIVEFFDYECPACRYFWYDLRDIEQEFEGKVAVEYRNYPLDSACNPSLPRGIHQHACEAAEFARCAGEQDRFFEAHEYLLTLEAFEAGAEVDISTAIRSSITPLGLDRKAIVECLNSDRQLVAIRKDIEIANRLGLQATPSVWVDGRAISHRDTLRDLITELVALQPAPETPVETP